MVSASASLMAGTRKPTTPRARARSRAASRSPSARLWRWQWESTTPGSGGAEAEAELIGTRGAPPKSPLLHPRAGRNFVLGTQQYGVAILRGREDHALGLDAHELGGLEVGDDDDLAADELLRRVGLADAGDDGALLVAEVDRELDELARLGDLLGSLDGGELELDLHEVVVGDRSRSRRWSRSRSWIRIRIRVHLGSLIRRCGNGGGRL